jgi:hypothetical protein
VVTIPEELDRDSVYSAIREGIEDTRALIQDCLDTADHPRDQENYAALLRQLDGLASSEPVGSVT